MIGVFWKSGEFDFTEKHRKWYIFFTFIIFIALILIFLGAYEYSAGVSLLSHLVDSIGGGIGDDVLTGAIALVVIVGIILWIVRRPNRGDDK